MAPSGRGGYSGGTNNINKIGGQALPFDVDADLEATFGTLPRGSTGIFPDGTMPFPDPPTEREKKSVAAYKKIRDGHRNGPFYAELEAGSDGTKRSAAETHDPFEDAPTYGKMQKKKPRTLPSFNKVKIDKSLMPKELWHIIGEDGYIKELKGKDRFLPRGVLPMSELIARPDTGKTMLEKLAYVADDTEGAGETADDEEGDKSNDDEDEAPEEIKDDTFEDDEDEHDDYNAERYFDGGEDQEEAQADDGAEDW